ncbi:MAG: MarR family winged helix-turn-helix transcriptional regulator [Chloroflexota bacterium]
MPSVLADLHLAYHLLDRLMRRHLEEAAVSMSEALVLRLVARNSRATITDLCMSSGLAAPTVSCIVTRLEHRGYVRRRRLGADQRVVFVTPRKPGVVIASMVESAIDDVMTAVLAHATPRDVAGLGLVARALDLIERPERPSPLD